MSPAVPSWWGVAASVLLVVVTVAVVVREQLGLTRDVVVSSVRAVVQLVAVGALLGVLFERAGCSSLITCSFSSGLTSASSLKSRSAPEYPHSSQVCTR